MRSVGVARDNFVSMPRQHLFSDRKTIGTVVRDLPLVADKFPAGKNLLEGFLYPRLSQSLRGFLAGVGPAKTSHSNLRSRIPMLPSGFGPEVRNDHLVISAAIAEAGCDSLIVEL